METASWIRGSSQPSEGGAIRRFVTLIGGQLLGVQWAVGSSSSAAGHWWDRRGGDSLWRELALEPARRVELANDPQSRLPVKIERRFEDRKQCATATSGITGVAVVQEDKAMEKVGSIGKFLQIGSVVQGERRSPRWFSLPGSWRAPRIQIMRHREQATTAERVENRSVRQLITAGSRGGW